MENEITVATICANGVKIKLQNVKKFMKTKFKSKMKITCENNVFAQQNLVKGTACEEIAEILKIIIL